MKTHQEFAVTGDKNIHDIMRQLNFVIQVKLEATASKVDKYDGFLQEDKTNTRLCFTSILKTNKFCLA